MILFKKMNQYHLDVFSKTHLISYILVAILSFVFIKIDFDNKSYMLNAASICSADLMYSIKDNLLFITIITAVFIYITFRDFDYQFSYNVVLRYSERKHLYKSQLFCIIYKSVISSLFVVLILFVESFLLTKKIINWNLESSYYGFVNGKTYNHSIYVFCFLLIFYVFSFVCSQMLVGLCFRWIKINNYYMFFSLFAFVGIIMAINRMMIIYDYTDYGFSILNTLPYIIFFIIIFAISLIIMNKTVPKREFF